VGLVVAVVAIVALVVVLSGDDGGQGAARVYCLASDQRGELLDVARGVSGG
jgi:hypothetical protein